MLKVVIWGTGGSWRYIKEYIDYDEVEIVGFIDNNPLQDSVCVKGKKTPVYLPENYFGGEGIWFDKIFIASQYFEEIQKQLETEFAIGLEKIEVYQHPSRLIVKESYFRERKNADDLDELQKRICTQMHLQAKLLNAMNMSRVNLHSIRETEYKVYSQWGEDGIIQYLTHKIPIKNKTFIEFGVENYQEANTRFLLEENNWSGMIIDGSCEKMNVVKQEELYWRYDLKAVSAFVTKENINELLQQSGFDSDLGLLSIDIDGNDYWILQEINTMRPRILICEYNAIYGEHEAVTILYESNFIRTQKHYSNLYFGASLEAIKLLAKKKGYHFIGTNSNACNAFFVREDLVSYLPESIIKDNEFISYKYRQARGRDGKLLFLSKEEELEMIADMDLYDINEKKLKKVCELKF